ncbi:MAG: rubrerythrin [Bradyrhizobiaceae bacterium]|nr:MAG: rubrerythrin [Bradyrhizobiaceae bacterium]
MTQATPEITSLPDLLAVAWRIEADAVERYQALAAQMETFNNAELAAVFRDLARAEGIHAEEIRRMAGDLDVAARAREIDPWRSGESPESADLAEAHYKMTPWHALQLALAGEQRALAFFDHILKTATDEAVRKMAAEFVEEENEHVDLVRRLLRRHREPSENWSEDPDAPVAQD